MAVSVDSILYADVGQGADDKGPGYGLVLAKLDLGTYANPAGVVLTAAVLSAALVAVGYAPIAAIESCKLGFDDDDGTYFASAVVADGDATITAYVAADADADAVEVTDEVGLGAESFTAWITVSHRS